MGYVDLTGQRRGSLTMTAPCCIWPKAERVIRAWSCSCDCGATNHVVRTGNLSGNKPVKSCGCQQGFNRHGHKQVAGMTPTYQSWRGMKERCLSEKHIQWDAYGGRGIKICDRWLGESGFKNFLEDMGERPGKEYSIDRINVDGDYEPSNCRWATRAQQSMNKRTSKFWTFKGETLCETELTRRFGINLRTFRHRIALGWGIEDALTRPIQKHRPKVPLSKNS